MIQMHINSLSSQEAYWPSGPHDLFLLPELLARFSNNTLLRDDNGVTVRYADIAELARSKAFKTARRRLVICGVNNDVYGLQGYLALLAAGAVPMMVSPTLSQTARDALVTAYRPDFLWMPQQDVIRWPGPISLTKVGDYALASINNDIDLPPLYDDLALLLSTSGSTGGIKYVRLSHQNFWSNAIAIALYLGLTADELAVTTLPPNYSYGLSIIHSHLWVGAGLAVTNKTLFDRDFWSFLGEVRATSLSGVPYHFEMLKKLRFAEMALPNLRTLTQAGGQMSKDLTQEFATHCQNNGRHFFSMYGQTEASPRMSYVPAEKAVSKAGTIGIPIPGGQFELRSESGTLLTGDNIVGEIVYRGPNVCLGYAECRADLSLGDVNCGVLNTGDLAERDSDGYYRIVGRKNRFVKIFGNRINLQDVEQLLLSAGANVACSGRDDVLEVYLATGSGVTAIEIKKTVMASLRLSAQGIAVYQVDRVPRNESGKVRYADLHPEKALRLA
jgi:long-chain acyl-CoA synthetase